MVDDSDSSAALAPTASARSAAGADAPSASTDHGAGADAGTGTGADEGAGGGTGFRPVIDPITRSRSTALASRSAVGTANQQSAAHGETDDETDSGGGQK
jgi:hypothetical protein